jgi:hypothetical protein
LRFFKEVTNSSTSSRASPGNPSNSRQSLGFAAICVSLIRETCNYSTPNYTAPQISSSFALIFASKISISFRFDSFPTQVAGDFTELFEGGFEVFDDFLGEDVEISNITPDP